MLNPSSLAHHFLWSSYANNQRLQKQKHLWLRIAITILPLSLTTLSDISSANGATESKSQGTSGHQFIAKQDKSANVNAQQQADIDSIHQTIAQFYRGMNEFNVDRMEKASLSVPAADKASMRRMFDRLKANNIDMSIEVRNIELVSFSQNNAIVKIDQVVKGRKGNRSTESKQTGSLLLVKYRGKWKIGGTDSIVKSMSSR
jgi:hypothetical protein